MINVSMETLKIMQSILTHVSIISMAYGVSGLIGMYIDYREEIKRDKEDEIIDQIGKK